MSAGVGRFRTIRTAADVRDEVHGLLRALRTRSERKVGSRMVAYADLGRAIGASGSWVRKLLGRHPVAVPGHVLDNIRSAYAHACERIEAEADEERRAFLALGRQHHGPYGEGAAASRVLASAAQEPGLVAAEDR